ncbi:Mobile element protein [uncultured Candidatus Thioglobus sp.]|nr:Mobile element protein [uncultured Candidatus Thioglobus sp.]
MRKIKEVLRLRFAAQLSVRKISASTKISVGGIQKLLTKVNNLSLSWPLPEELDGGQLAKMFYPRADTRNSSRFKAPDWATVHRELKPKGVTKDLLWQEYT